MNLPGQEWAEKYGYHLTSYNGEARTQATYFNEELELYLTIRKQPNGDLVATLEHIKGIVRIVVDEFSFPHKLFHNFERMIMQFYKED